MGPISSTQQLVHMLNTHLCNAENVIVKGNLGRFLFSEKAKLDAKKCCDLITDNKLDYFFIG